jgi:hypothetical protein
MFVFDLGWRLARTESGSTRDRADEGPCGIGLFWTCVCSGMAYPDVNSTHYESTQNMLAAQLTAVGPIMHST